MTTNAQPHALGEDHVAEAISRALDASRGFNRLVHGIDTDERISTRDDEDAINELRENGFVRPGSGEAAREKANSILGGLLDEDHRERPAFQARGRLAKLIGGDARQALSDM